MTTDILLKKRPTWLKTLTRIDPITYIVDPMRRAVFEHLDVPSFVNRRLNPGVTWGAWRVPTVLELAIVVGERESGVTGGRGADARPAAGGRHVPGVEHRGVSREPDEPPAGSCGCRHPVLPTHRGGGSYPEQHLYNAVHGYLDLLNATHQPIAEPDDT